MNLKIKIKGREYIIDVQETGDKVIVAIDGNEYMFDANGNGTSAKGKKANTKKLSGAGVSRKQNSKQIIAPLSGTISEILVKPGDKIKAAQKFLTLSAMKMENEILAEADGKIKEIKVNKDQKVKEGELLIVLE